MVLLVFLFDLGVPGLCVCLPFLCDITTVSKKAYMWVFSSVLEIDLYTLIILPLEFSMLTTF